MQIILFSRSGLPSKKGIQSTLNKNSIEPHRKQSDARNEARENSSNRFIETKKIPLSRKHPTRILR
jgi:hypothetical protein